MGGGVGRDRKKKKENIKEKERTLVNRYRYRTGQREICDMRGRYATDRQGRLQSSTRMKKA